MGTIASQITSLAIVFSTVYLDADQRKHQGSASLAFVRGIHRRPVNSPHKWPVTRKMFPFDDVIMFLTRIIQYIWDTVDTPSTNLEPRENSFGALAKCSETPHYTDVIMGAIASQITSLTIVYSTVYSDADQRKHQSSTSLAFVRGIHRGPGNSSHKWPVTRFHLMTSSCIRNHDRLRFADELVHQFSWKDNLSQCFLNIPTGQWGSMQVSPFTDIYMQHNIPMS